MLYWLMKTEPETFSIEDLAAMGSDHWDGVRNYQARNFMRDEMKEGDKVLIYHSGKFPAVVGTARVVREGYPDHTAWDPSGRYYDPKSSPENPRWYMVDVGSAEKFAAPVPLARLRTVEGLEDMMLLRKGMRLSVQPVTESEYRIICELAGMPDS